MHAKRLEEGKPLSRELEQLFWTRAKRGVTDEVSLRGLDRRWRHLMDLPEPDKPLPEDLQKYFAALEARRLKEVAELPAKQAVGT